MSKLIVIIGAGPGISQAVAEKFGSNDFTVALIARHKNSLEKLTADLTKKGIDAYGYIGDAGDAESMKDAFNQIWEKWNDIDVVHYNAAKIKQVNIINETADALTRDFKVNVAGVMTVVNLVVSDMEKRGEGTILLTGGDFGSLPNPEYGSLAVGKAGLRTLAGALHSALKPKNIFVGTVTISGWVKPGEEKYNPKNVAENFWTLYTERKDFEIQF